MFLFHNSIGHRIGHRIGSAGVVLAALVALGSGAVLGSGAAQAAPHQVHP